MAEPVGKTAVLLVLVVEDDTAIQNVLEDTLVEAGFEVRQAFTAEEAMKLLDAPDFHFRALITDIDLKSGLTGWDVARHARQIEPDLPVIYATSTAHEWESMGAEQHPDQEALCAGTGRDRRFPALERQSLRGNLNEP